MYRSIETAEKILIRSRLLSECVGVQKKQAYIPLVTEPKERLL
jgi:hypothetical protein